MAFALGSMIAGAAKALISPLTTVVDGWQQRKTAKVESDIEINKTKTDSNVKRMETKQQGDIAWENTSIDKAGWKDEYWTIVISIPMIMCFVPYLASFVEAGFAALNNTPEWYQWAVGISIGSSFGVKKFTNFMALKKGV